MAGGLRVNTESNGAGAGGLALTATGIRVSVDATGGANVASVLKLTSTGLSVGVDDVGIEETAAGGNLRLKDLGVTTAKLAANAATVDKLNLQWREEEFAAAGFTDAGGGEFQVTLAGVPLEGTQVDGFVECYRNGIADMTNVGPSTASSTINEFRAFDDSSTGRLRIGGDVTGTGNTYRVRYLSLA